MKRIRGGSGLGDSLYVRPIVEHFVRSGEDVTVCSDFKDVFRGSGAKVEPFTRTKIDVLAHYTQGKNDPNTTQWQDICRSAGVTVPLQFAWKVRNSTLVDQMRDSAAGRQIIVVLGGREPMGRTDGFGRRLLPEPGPFKTILEELRDYYLVRIGKGEQIYSLPTDEDLNGRTSVSDLLDVASICAGAVGQCSFIVPLAEVFDKPLLAVWASSGLSSNEPYIKTITPKKILSKSSSRYVMDDWPVDSMREIIGIFRRSIA